MREEVDRRRESGVIVLEVGLRRGGVDAGADGGGRGPVRVEMRPRREHGDLPLALHRLQGRVRGLVQVHGREGGLEGLQVRGLGAGAVVLLQLQVRVALGSFCHDVGVDELVSPGGVPRRRRRALVVDHDRREPGFHLPGILGLLPNEIIISTVKTKDPFQGVLYLFSV